MKTYCVVYRTGGTENFKWHRTIPFNSFDDAVECMEATVRMGYKCMVEDYSSSVDAGLPETYEYVRPFA